MHTVVRRLRLDSCTGTRAGSRTASRTTSYLGAMSLLIGVAATAAACTVDSDSTAQGGTDTAAVTGTAGSESTAGTTGATTAGTTAPGTTATTTSASTTGAASTSDTTTSGVDGCEPAALELIGLVNAYRAEQGLAAIPASPSLCMVGQTHAVDLHEEEPHEVGNCNLHSWSDAGSWGACCYTGDHAQAQCMWDKPRELTAYSGNGYENAAMSTGTLTPERALELWKGSSAHNDVILNRGIWADRPWRALGAGVHEGYAVLWFGHEDDPAAR